MNDLSEYERKRLENIRRNEKILKELGLSSDKIPIKKKKVQKKKVKKKKKKNVAKKRKTTSSSGGVRKSRRLQGMEVEHKARQNILDPNSETLAEKNDGSDDDGTIKYYEMPREPESLDDEEFLIYVKLRKWRLIRHRELCLEPYKIFQNRTLCEMVRRKRNDKNWASASGKEEKVAEDLLMVWGIGPAKVYGNVDSSRGFAIEALEVLNNDKENDDLFQRSRDREEEPWHSCEEA